MTYILSFIVAFGVAAIAGQLLIPLLRRLKAGQADRKSTRLNSSHPLSSRMPSSA